MSHTLIGAGRTTHLKIVCLALIGAIAVVLIGMTARVADSNPRLVLKSAVPAVFSAHDTTMVR